MVLLEGFFREGYKGRYCWSQREQSYLIWNCSNAVPNKLTVDSYDYNNERLEFYPDVIFLSF